MSKHHKGKEASFLGTDEFSMTHEYRESIGCFEKFEKYELQEALCKERTNWLLSNDDIKLSVEMPHGICKSMPTLLNADNMLVMLYPCPEDEEILGLDYREIYQIIRELTVGIYGFHQLPGIELESNFDRNTVCDMPQIYTNTRIGQHLINVDYTMKCLWHGAYFPPQKRQKWGEKWRSTLAVNNHGNPETKRDVFEEFVAAGMVPITKLKEYSKSYDDYNQLLERENLIDPKINKIFQEKIHDLSMKMNFYTSQVRRTGNVFMVDSDWKLETCLKTIVDDLDRDTTEILLKLLKMQRDIVQENLENLGEIRVRIFKLRLLATLIPFLIGLRKRMMIPDVTKMMNPLLGDEIRTEKELPPLMVNPNFPNFTFSSTHTKYFPLHGGIQFDLFSPDLEPLPRQLDTESIKQNIEKVAGEAGLIAQSESTYTDKNPVRTITDEAGKRYFVIPIYFETYYNQAPKKPNWVRAISEESAKLRTKKLPISENSLFDLFKKFYGQQAAIANKNIGEALRSCSRRGLVAMFEAECRKCPINRISKQDESGWSLMHHAAMNNKVHLIGGLLLQSQDVNVRRYNTVTETSPTPLHAAVTTGSLSAVTCLVNCGANIKSANKDGWMPIHCTVYFDQVVILNLLLKLDSDLVNISTRNDLRQTPILLASSSESLDCIAALIDNGARINVVDSEGKGVVHMAVLSFRNKAIEYFIRMNDDKVPVWPILLSMLKSDNQEYIQKTIYCLEYLTKYSKLHWPNILQNDLIPAIVNLLEIQNQILHHTGLTDDDVESIKYDEIKDAKRGIEVDTELLISTSSMLCNICVEKEVQLAMKDTEIVKIAVGLFDIADLRLKSQLAFILDHLCNLEVCQNILASLNGHKNLEKMILEASETPEKQIKNIPILINGINAIQSFCRENSTNQILIVNETKIAHKIIEFLAIRNGAQFEVLLVASSLAISSIVKDCNANRKFFITNKCVKPLLNLIKYRSNVKVQVAAANATEQLCYDNLESRQVFLDEETELHLIHLLKDQRPKYQFYTVNDDIWSVEVKEQGMRSLWSLAGIHITGQRFIAERIGASLLIELIMSKSEILQSLGCCALAALCNESKRKQELILRENGVQPLVRLLRQTSSSEFVLKTAVKTIGILCVGIAHCSNMSVQTSIAAEGAIETLVEIWGRHNSDVSPNTEAAHDIFDLKIEIGYTLAAITLNHSANEERLARIFDFCDLIRMLELVDDRVLLLRCLTSIAVFCFNNTSNQFAVKEAGGVQYNYLKQFTESTDSIENIHGAFNMAILARDIKGHNQVSITAEAVNILVTKLSSQEDHVVILAASLTASLCHTRAGIPDAFVSLDTVRILLQLLLVNSNNNKNNNMQIRSTASVALGYLSFNGTAARLMMKECRRDFDVFDKLQLEIDKMGSKISSEFVENYLTTQRIGLPYKYLECNGGYPVYPNPERFRVKSSLPRNSTRSQVSSAVKKSEAENSIKRPKTSVLPRFNRDLTF